MLSSRVVPILRLDGLSFRDLDRDGHLSPFEDWRLTPQQRAGDLVARMTLSEKAGVMMHANVPLVGARDSAYDMVKAAHLVQSLGISTMLTRLVAAPVTLARQNNQLQELAEHTRLAIPMTISSDPRHHFQATVGASLAANGFSQWPEPLGLAAIGDPALVRRFGEAVRREYRAVGIHQSLAPQADLSTEPRWARINGTFGEDVSLVGRLVGAYVQGVQGDGTRLATDGVSAVVKHWVGYGAALDGWDSHSFYGRFASLTPETFKLHVLPFLPAFDAGVSGVMPTYSILRGLQIDGQPIEAVGAGFNRWLITDQLRGHYHYQGVVISDWAITNDCDSQCRNGAPAGATPDISHFSTAWGTEALSKQQRFVKAILAGVDQFGGVDDTEEIVHAVNSGAVSIQRVDDAVRRILQVKFALGLFENPYVDVEQTPKVAGASDLVAQGLDAQVRSHVLLQNRGALLPLKFGVRVYAPGVNAAALSHAGLVAVNTPNDADVAVLRVDAPHTQPHPQYVFGLRQHEGDLSFPLNASILQQLRRLPPRLPVIVSVYLDRPAILTPLMARANALLVNFGASDEALARVLVSHNGAHATLPLELPSSMEAVKAQRPDVPHDSRAPLYPMHFGLQD